MKKSIIYIASVLIFLSGLSCTKEKLQDSIIDTSTPNLNATDQWIRSNFTLPYNIEVLYKWDDGETTVGKNLVPPKQEVVIPLMQMLDSVWIAPYIRAAGKDFFKQYTPKQFLLIGSPSYNSDGSRTQGTAEGGRKIVLYSLNWFNPKDKAQIWEEYIHVIFHEFGHILHQTKNYNPDYKNVISGYTAAWTDFSDAEALEKGFITAYSLSGPDEDFVEIMSIYITTSPSSWDTKVNGIQNALAKAAIQRKLEIVTNYMKSSWHIDINALRADVNASFDRYVSQ